MSTNILETAKSLPLPQLIELAEALWERIIQDGYEPELTTAQAVWISYRFREKEITLCS